MASTKVQRFWFVIPNDIQGTGNVWHGPANQPRRDALMDPEPARARGNRPAQPRMEEEDAPQADQGYGLFLATKESKEIMAFTTREKAAEYAKYLATMNPQKLFGVFSCDQIYETTEPTVLQKKFNDAGELVLESGV